MKAYTFPIITWVWQKYYSTTSSQNEVTNIGDFVSWKIYSDLSLYHKSAPFQNCHTQKSLIVVQIRLQFIIVIGMILFNRNKVHNNWAWSFVPRTKMFENWHKRNVRCLIRISTIQVVFLFLVFHCLFICQSKWWQMVAAELMSSQELQEGSKRHIAEGWCWKKEKVTLHSHNCFFPRLNRRPNSSRTRYCGSSLVAKSYFVSNI